MICNDYFEYPGVILDALVAICKEYHSKVFKLEGDKWDLERGIKIRILEVPTRLSIFLVKFGPVGFAFVLASNDKTSSDLLIALFSSWMWPYDQF